MVLVDDLIRAVVWCYHAISTQHTSKIVNRSVVLLP